MIRDTIEATEYTERELQDLVAYSDSGSRNPTGSLALFISIIAVFWSLFQVVLASPVVNHLLPGDLINNSRQIHLAFAMFLAFMVYPAVASSPRNYIPVQDWVFAIAGTFTALYGLVFYEKIVRAGGIADETDKWVALAGLFFVFEAARRALGPALAVIASVFLIYIFFGSSEWVPEVIRWKGASLTKAMSHLWITSEGVFGLALGVSTKFVFLFVLFGALLEKAGAGNYFIKLAFGALGHLKGGPAKAAVVGSAATGLISGSSIANVVTTGTFTIPLMKRVGFTSEKAGAVEVASSVNGQIMPPVMGAAAFLMVEYVGIPYVQVITHAFLPAAISYIALVYIVHLEAVKQNMPTLGNRAVSLLSTIMGMFLFFGGFAAICYAVKYPVAFISSLVPEQASWILALMMVTAYIALVWVAARHKDLEPDDPHSQNVELPVVSEIYQTGLYYLLPIIVLVYFLMVEQKSPGFSAFWSTMLLFVILLTQRPLKALFRGQAGLSQELFSGVKDLIAGLNDGARNMTGIGLATATAGVIVGTVTLTGVGQVMADLVEFLSGGNLIAMLLLVGFLSLFLGMGLPTTANYIVVSSLLAGVVVELGAQSDLVVPLIAVHLFVFYFGIMADVTPPVGLASFAAAAVSGGDAIKTGFTAFFYSLRTVALPFVFIFNTDLLLIDVGLFEGIVVFIVAAIGMLVFTAGTMGWFITRSRFYESIALVLIAFALFRPGFFMDRIDPPFEDYAPQQLSEVMAGLKEGEKLRLVISGPDFDTLKEKKYTLIAEAEPVSATAGLRGGRLEALGLMTVNESNKVLLEEPFVGTPFYNDLSTFDFYGDIPVMISSVKAQADQLPKELIYFPAFLLLAGIAFMQSRRERETYQQEVCA